MKETWCEQMSFHTPYSETTQCDVPELREQEYDRHFNEASFAFHKHLPPDALKLRASLEFWTINKNPHKFPVAHYEKSHTVHAEQGVIKMKFVSVFNMKYVDLGLVFAFLF